MTCSCHRAEKPRYVGHPTVSRSLSLPVIGSCLRKPPAYSGQAAAQVCHCHVNRACTVNAVNVRKRKVVLSGQSFAVIKLQQNLVLVGIAPFCSRGLHTCLRQKILLHHACSHSRVRPFRRLDTSRRNSHALVFSICSACLREVSVSFAPLNMRATSSVRSSPVMRRTAVRVRSEELFFSIT